MLNRLAELLIRRRPQLGRALRITYPYVFVDEFQDTTAAQLSFLDSVFSDTTVTAVGDRKQRIMGFAGGCSILWLCRVFDEWQSLGLHP